MSLDIANTAKYMYAFFHFGIKYIDHLGLFVVGVLLFSKGYVILHPSMDENSDMVIFSKKL